MSGQQADQSGGAAVADSSEPLRVIKNLLTSYHESNQAAGAQQVRWALARACVSATRHDRSVGSSCVQLYDMAKDHAAEIVQSDLLPFLVIMLEAKQE
jgi:hypothetical protein